MSPLAPDFLERNRILLAILAIILSALTWTSDFAGLVYECPYCRTQRSAIGVLGLILLLPFYQHWIMRMLGTGIGVLGLVVAAMQNFNHWKNIFAGTFEWGERWYMNAWMLSGFALFILTALLMILWSATHSPHRADA